MAKPWLFLGLTVNGGHMEGWWRGIRLHLMVASCHFASQGHHLETIEEAPVTKILLGFILHFPWVSLYWCWVFFLSKGRSFPSSGWGYTREVIWWVYSKGGAHPHVFFWRAFNLSYLSGFFQFIVLTVLPSSGFTGGYGHGTLVGTP